MATSSATRSASDVSTISRSLLPETEVAETCSGTTLSWSDVSCQQQNIQATNQTRRNQTAQRMAESSSRQHLLAMVEETAFQHAQAVAHYRQLLAAAEPILSTGSLERSRLAWLAPSPTTLAVDALQTWHHREPNGLLPYFDSNHIVGPAVFALSRRCKRRPQPGVG
jgi:hypothetical protein